MKNPFHLLLILLLLIGCACTPMRKITYAIDDVVSLQDSMYTGATLSVIPFKDQRQSEDDTLILFENNRTAKVEGERMCINSEKHYDAEKIPIQVATMLHKHLNATGAFKEVYLITDTGQYRLTGDIVRLFGKQEFSTAAVVGAQFGLLGAIATSGIKTDGVIRITLTNLLLTNTKMGKTHELEEIDLQFEGEYNVDANCWSVYAHVNNKLKQAVDERLVPSIITAIQSEF